MASSCAVNQIFSTVPQEKKMLVTEENVSNALALCNTKISLLLDALGNTEKVLHSSSL